MSTIRDRCSFYAQPTRAILRAPIAVLVAAMLVAAAPFADGQISFAKELPANFVAAHVSAARVSLELPDSPGYLASSSVDSADLEANPLHPQVTPPPSRQPPNARTKHSVHLGMTIAPNEIAVPMPAGDKIVGGLKDSVSVFSATGWLLSAGYSHLNNGSPNFGTDKGAFGRRLGAAAMRDISDDVFTDCLFAPIFHEDPRYYIMGRGNNFFKRVVYSGTRAIVTRTDGGHTTPNFALLSGAAAGAALTTTYYPAQNTSFKEVAETFGGSLGGSAIGFVATEFIADALQYLHLKKQ